ncbi:hypothetical protein MTO96_026516 [Rhipicephalus appendiculatus]
MPSGRFVLFYVRRRSISRACQPCPQSQFLFCVLQKCFRLSRLRRLCSFPFSARSLHRWRRAIPPIGAASLPACSGPYCAEGALERKFRGRFSRSTGLLWAATVQTPFVEMAPIQASAP